MTRERELCAPPLEAWARYIVEASDETLEFARPLGTVPCAQRLYPHESHHRLVLRAEPPLAEHRHDPCAALSSRDREVKVERCRSGLSNPEPPILTPLHDLERLRRTIYGWLHPIWTNRVAREVWALAASGEPIERVLKRLARDTSGGGSMLWVAMAVF